MYQQFNVKHNKLKFDQMNTDNVTHIQWMHNRKQNMVNIFMLVK